jgi:Lrp/AsnC family leucine-responsive transcriptional regulator
LLVDLDGIDIAILKSLMENGRKSFRAISREIKVSTPTIKSRYERLVNIGLIKSVKPEIDLSKVNKGKQSNVFEYETIKELEKQKKHFHVKLDKNMKVKMQCEYCGGPIHAEPKILSLQTFRAFSAALAAKTTIKKSMKAGYSQ